MAISRAELDERQELTPTEFFNSFYRDSGLDQQLVEELLVHVVQELGLPSGKLRPSDQFLGNLIRGGANSWDSGFGVLAFELKRLAKKRRISLETPINTLDEYLWAMSKVY